MFDPALFVSVIPFDSGNCANGANNICVIAVVNDFLFITHADYVGRRG